MQIWRVNNAHVAQQRDVSQFVSIASVCSNPNGIERTADSQHLIVTCPEGLLRLTLSTREFRMVTSAGDASASAAAAAAAAVPDMSVHINGLLFDSSRTVLYGTSNGIRVRQPFDRVVALYSADNWETCEVVHVFRAGCPAGYPAALAWTPDNNLHVLCSAAFGDGPYGVNFIRSVDAQISSDGSLFSSSSSSSGGGSGDDDASEEDNDETTTTGSSSSSGLSRKKSDDDDYDDDNNGFENEKNVALLTIGLIVLVALAVYIVLHNLIGKGAKPAPAAGAAAGAADE